jgi:hypothetical protein
MLPELRHAAIAAAVALTIASWVRHSGATVVAEDELEDSSSEVGVVLRGFGFLQFGDVLEPPFNIEDQNPAARGIFDARLYAAHRTPNFKLVLHNQLTLSLSSHVSLSPLDLGRGVSPPRWLPLTFEHDEPTLTLRSDADWIYAAYTAGPMTFTVGRQPITFGRGALWRTSDRISTFALTEVDTEYKPGADALRIDITAAEQTQITALAAVGELESSDHDAEVELRGSSFVAQLKQGWDGGEFGVVGGFVRYDAMLGVDAVFDFGAFDLYAELTATKFTADSLSRRGAVFGSPPPAADDTDTPVFSALLGMTLRPTGSLTIQPELMYNGFGAWEPEDYFEVALSERVGIGEQNALGQLYAGWSSDYEMDPLWHLFQSFIVNPRDPSALLLLGISHSIAANAEVLLGGYVPMGHKPEPFPPVARSEYGAYPYFFFTELKGTI